jgi:hypothetical protein
MTEASPDHDKHTGDVYDTSPKFRQFYSITLLTEAHEQKHYGSYSISTSQYIYDTRDILLHDYPSETEYPFERRMAVRDFSAFSQL